MMRGRAFPAVLIPLLLSCSGCDQERQVAAEANKQAAPADSSQSPRAQRVRQIIGELLGVPAARVVDQASIRDLGGDSLDFVEIVMALEEEFSVEISDEDAERLETVADLVSYVERPR